MVQLDNLAAYFAATPSAFLLIVTLLGLLVGSFLNVVIYRLPVMMEKEWLRYIMEFLYEAKNEDSLKHLHEISRQLPDPKSQDEEVFNLMLPASSCPHCDHKIRAWENIPVVSYLFLRGKCSGCKEKIHWRYPTVEFVTGALSLLIAAYFGFSAITFYGLILLWCLIALTMIDFDHKLLPDQITLPLLWLGILINISGTLVPLQESVIGAIAGYLSLWSVFWLFKLLTGKEGMGYGDFKLLAALGAWMGWTMLPLIVVLSSLVGAVVGLSLILIMGRDKNIPIPFGPYLAAAGLLAYIWGDAITRSYFNYLS